jgi:sugar (pentulose or hexulose) kinase
MADVFGAEVRRVQVENAAALGAALRALHADRIDDGAPLEWDAVIDGFEAPAPDRISPDRAQHDLYAAQRLRYARFELASRPAAGVQ